MDGDGSSSRRGFLWGRPIFSSKLLATDDDDFYVMKEHSSNTVSVKIYFSENCTPCSDVKLTIAAWYF